MDLRFGRCCGWVRGGFRDCLSSKRNRTQSAARKTGGGLAHGKRKIRIRPRQAKIAFDENRRNQRGNSRCLKTFRRRNFKKSFAAQTIWRGADRNDAQNRS